MTYRIKWLDLSKHMTRQLFIIISVGFTAIMFIRLVATGFSLDETFEHIKLTQLPLVYLAILAFSIFFAYLIGALLTCTKITVENGVISGRNYWLYKRKFPLDHIEAVFPFNSNGMPVIVVDAGKKGQIYVPIHIEKADELFKILDKCTGNA